MSWKLVSELAVRWAVPAALSALAGVIGGAISASIVRRKAKKEQDTTRDLHIATGVQCLLRAEIIRSAEKYHDKGYCPVYARDALTRAYDSYHNLGGNDVATELFHRTIDLPTDPEKPEKEVH